MIHTTTFTTHWWGNTAQGLLLLFVPFLFSCENEDFLSLPTDPGSPNLEIQYSRIAIPFTLVQLDSVRTSPVNDDSRTLAGRFTNADLGEVSSTTFVEFGVASTRPDVEENAQYDSLVFQTIYDRSYGPAAIGSIQTLAIRRTTQPFADSTVYYSDDVLPVDETSTLGSVRLRRKLGEEADTVRFRLDDVLGQDLFQRAQEKDSSVIVSSQFQAFFPGIALVPTDDNSFVGSFNARGGRLIMYFTNADNEAETYEFPVANYFNAISSDRAGTALATLGVPDQEVPSPDGRFYLQSGTAVTPVIDLGVVLDSLRGYSADTTRQPLLNRVELNIGLASVADTLNAPSSVSFYNFSTRFQRLPRFDRTGSFIGYAGVFSDQAQQGIADRAILTDDGQYRLPVTNYITTLLASESPNTSFIVLGENFDQAIQQVVTLSDSVYLDVYYSSLVP